MSNALWNPVRYSSDRDAAEAVADQDHVFQLLGLIRTHWIADEGGARLVFRGHDPCCGHKAEVGCSNESLIRLAG